MNVLNEDQLKQIHQNLDLALEVVMPNNGLKYNTDAINEFYDIVDRRIIVRVLRKTSGNQCRTAAILKINRNTLRKKCLKLKINCQKIAKESGIGEKN